MAVSAMFTGIWPFTARWQGYCTYGGATFATIKRDFQTHDAAMFAAAKMEQFVKTLDNYPVDRVDEVLRDYGYRRA